MGGFQKLTIMVTQQTTGGTCEQMVMRAEKDDRFVRCVGSAVVDEFEIIRLARRAGVPRSC